MLIISQHSDTVVASPAALPKRFLLLLMISLGGLFNAQAADIETARDHFLSGNYSNAIHLARAAVDGSEANDKWHELLIKGLITTGQYRDARSAATNALAIHPRSLTLRWMTRKALLCVGEPEAAAAMAEEVAVRALSEARRYQDASSMVVAGRALLLQRVDPKQVLDKLYERARQSDPTLREVYLASGELALEKSDYALAARWFREGLDALPADPDLQFGLARAYAPSEPVLAMEALTAALERNSNHLGSLLLLTDRKIDAESYDDADALLDSALAVNPVHPEAWTYRAVIAHLQNQHEAAQEAREKALQFWPTNPRVDYLMGLKLSQKYRFIEGANHQMQALLFDGDYEPALLQLAQDLLRLGQEADGWQLAKRVQSMDEYDVTANNLVALHDVLQDFQTLTNDHFLLRMEPHEARVYGARALKLLNRARTDLCAKYGFELRQPTTVEVFHRQSDFAVRTFGMPENHGFLGVCFGRVITANSPASRPGQSFNWESMLWHEFCHVVTLQLTGNKIPRWLSEGISVYEERQVNPAWGEQLTPAYREMLLGDDLTPVSELSSAFFTPRSNLHLQFAYYQSSLVVEFLVQHYGYDALIALLHDLGRGTEINTALATHTASIDALEPAFVEFAHEKARSLAPRLDWEKPDLATLVNSGSESLDESDPPLVFEPARRSTDIEFGSEGWQRWAEAHPTNFYVMTRQAQAFMREEQWTNALPILEELIERFPNFVGTSSAYLMLAETHQAMGNTTAEQRVLTAFAEREDEATDVYLRLMEMVTAEEDWPSVIENAHRYLAVDPLVVPPYRHLAQASEAAGNTEEAIAAYRALLELDPVNPAELHYRLAKLLHEAGDPAARRHLLQALEDAPRYREALELLLLLEMETTDNRKQNSTETVSET